MLRFKLCLIQLFFTVCAINAQNKEMRPLETLLSDTTGWPLVKKWVAGAHNKVQLLPVEINKAKKALYNTQVTTRSPMGAVIYYTGGILVDDGWIRILGSGGNNILNRDIPGWNENKSITYKGLYAYLLIADDAAGGFFAINNGELGADVGNVYYLPPDGLNWESLERGYSGFLDFCFNSNLEKFYYGLKWKDWQKDVSTINGDKAYSFYPFLWTKEGKDINNVSRKVISTEELYKQKIEIQQQLSH